MDFRRPLKVLTPTLDGDVLAVLARGEQELSGREVHRLVGHSSEQGVRRALERLAEQGVVFRRRAGRANLYALNRDHVAAPAIEQLARLRSELIDRLRQLSGAWKIKPTVALLFGSVARGDAGPRSDLDLLLIRPADRDPDDADWRAQLDELESSASAWTGNDARVLEYGVEELADGLVEESVIADALRDGIELIGSRRALRGTENRRSGG